MNQVVRGNPNINPGDFSGLYSDILSPGQLARRVSQAQFVFARRNIRQPKFPINTGYLVVRVVKDVNPCLHGPVIDAAKAQRFGQSPGMIEFLHVLAALDQVDVEGLGTVVGHHVVE